MTTLFRVATAVGLGLGLAVLDTPNANAQSTPVPQVTQSVEGAHIATRSRGRVVYVAPRYHAPPRHYGGYNRGRYIAGGVAVGIAGAIILNEVARSSRPAYSYSSSYNQGGLTCAQLEARCDAGADWACRRLDRDPHC